MTGRCSEALVKDQSQTRGEREGMCTVEEKYIRGYVPEKVEARHVADRTLIQQCFTRKDFGDTHATRLAAGAKRSGKRLSGRSKP